MKKPKHIPTKADDLDMYMITQHLVGKVTSEQLDEYIKRRQQWTSV